MSRILAVDNEEKMCKLIKSSLELEGFIVQIATSGQAAFEHLERESFDVVVTDLRMNEIDGLQVLEHVKSRYPQTDVILITAFATQETALSAMKNGAHDYLIKPFKMDELIIRLRRIIRQNEIEKENRKLKKEVEINPEMFPGIIGKSKKMKQVFRQIQQVSESDTTVHIRGESGTGKELIAKAIHRNSSRKEGPFLAINCAALPESLLESELFGYEKGAFTGADRTKKGLFEQAEQGTIFLDEIGDMPFAIQAKLLRALQSNEIFHLGGQEKIKVNFRLISATNKDLEKLMNEKAFRSDLYYRINIFAIRLPTLRERKEDIPELVQHFLNEHPEIAISQPALKSIIEYDYPGNIRELENIITRAALTADQIIMEIEFPGKVVTASNSILDFNIPDEGVNLDEVEKKLIIVALTKAEGNKSKAAQLLGITRRRLYSMIERFAIQYDT